MKTSSTALGFLQWHSEDAYIWNFCVHHPFVEECFRLSGGLLRSVFNFPINLMEHFKLVI